MFVSLMRKENSEIMVLLVTKCTCVSESNKKCPGLICGTSINIVKPTFMFKMVDLWSYIMPINRYALKEIKSSTFEYL